MPKFGTFWDGPALGPYEELALNSFVSARQEIALYSYNRRLEVPMGVKWRDAHEVLEPNLWQRQLLLDGKYAEFTDFFRLLMMRKTKRVWVDTDIIYLGEDRWGSEYLFAYEDALRVCNAVLRLPRDADLLEDYIIQAETRLARGADSRGPGGSGPDLLTELIQKHSLWRICLSQAAFYPVFYRELWRLFDPKSAGWVIERTKNSSGLHLWNEFLNYRGLAKKYRPPRGSYLRNLFEELGLENSLRDMPAMDPDWPRNIWRRDLWPRRARARQMIYQGLYPAQRHGPRWLVGTLQRNRQKWGF